MKVLSDPIGSPGLYHGDNWVHPADYHASPRLSRSALVDILRSPAHFMDRMTNRQEPTEAMVVGDAIHTAVLEPDRFDAEYVYAEKFDRRTKAGKQAWAEWQAGHVGKKVVPHSSADTVREIARAVRNHPDLRDILTGRGLTEPSAAWDTEDGIGLRARPDRAIPKGGTHILADLKSAKDASPHGFAKEIAARKLHVQAAFYLDGFSAASGVKCDEFIFVVFEKTRPYACAVYFLDSESIAQGRYEYQKALDIYRECMRSGVWPDYAATARSIRIPQYAFEE